MKTNKTTVQHGNSIMVIHPYRLAGGVWVFDDPSTGLVREAFVAGMSEIMDEMAAKVGTTQGSLTVQFAAIEFPGAQFRLDHIDMPNAGAGNWYDFNILDGTEPIQEQGWLCPALFKYFPVAPRQIWVHAKPNTPVAAQLLPDQLQFLHN